MHVHRDSKEIEGLIGAMLEAWNRHDMDAYRAFWDVDAEMVNSAGLHHSGLGPIMAEQTWLHGGRFRHAKLRDLGHNVRFVGKDVAVVTMRCQIEGDPGHPGRPARGGVQRVKATKVVRRTAAGWRVVFAHNTEEAAWPFWEDMPSAAGVGGQWQAACGA